MGTSTRPTGLWEDERNTAASSRSTLVRVKFVLFCFFPITLTKESANLSTCDHSEVPQAGGSQHFQTQRQKPEMGPGAPSGVPSRMECAGWGSTLTPGPRCRGPPLFLGLASPRAKQAVVFWVLELGVVALHLLPLGHTGRPQSHRHRPSGAESLSAWEP